MRATAVPSWKKFNSDEPEDAALCLNPGLVVLEVKGSMLG